MGRRELGDERVRKIMRTGTKGASYALTLPKQIVRELGWKEKQKVVVRTEKGKIIIEDWKE